MTASMRARGPILLVLAAAVPALLVACSDPDDTPDAPVAEVRFAFLQSVDHLPYLVMRDQEFDRRNGFELVEQEAAGGRAALDAMLAGTVDVTYSGSVQIFAGARDGTVPGQLLPVGANTIADIEHPAIAVLAGPDVGGWRDLDGQAIAVNQIGSLGEVSAQIRLTTEGVEDFRFVEIAFANQGLAVSGGDVAAAVMSEPFLTQSLRRSDGTVLDWVIGGSPFPSFPYTFIVARGALARDDPELVRSFLRAHLEAVRWIGDHDAEARGLLAHRLGLDEAVAAEMRLNPYVPDARIDADLVAEVQAILAAADPAATPVDTVDLYDERLLVQVLDEAG